MAEVSWRRLCEEADPDFWKARRNEPAYQFAGRTFYQPREPYLPVATSTGTST